MTPEEQHQVYAPSECVGLGEYGTVFTDVLNLPWYVTEYRSVNMPSHSVAHESSAVRYENRFTACVCTICEMSAIMCNMNDTRIVHSLARPYYGYTLLLRLEPQPVLGHEAQALLVIRLEGSRYHLAFCRRRKSDALDHPLERLHVEHPLRHERHIAARAL